MGLTTSALATFFSFLLLPSSLNSAPAPPLQPRQLTWPDFTETRCYTRADPGPIINKTPPRPVHVASLAQKIADLDPVIPSEPARLRTFAAAGVHSDADYYLPLIKTHLTAQGGVTMRRGHESEKAYEFVNHIADGVRHIQQKCEGEKGYLGGATNLNKEMSLGIWGRKVIQGEEGEGEAEEPTEEEEVGGDWRDSVSSLEDLMGEGGGGTGMGTSANVQAFKREIEVS